MLFKRSVSLILMIQLLSPAAFASSGGSCVNASTLWKWVEGREPRVTASSICGGVYFTGQKTTQVGALLNLGDIDPASSKNSGALPPLTQVSVISESTEYIDDSNRASISIAEAETSDKLREACAQALLDFKSTTDIVFTAKHSVFDLKPSIDLKAPTPVGSQRVDSQGEYTYVSAKFSEVQKAAITSRLNSLGSCSSFSSSDSNGITSSSNCTLEQEVLTAKRVKHFRETMVGRIAIAVMLGALSNYYRGGEIFPSGDVVARGGNAAVLATIEPLVKGAPVELMSLGSTFVRAYLAQMIYQTHGFVSGGQKARGIGAHGYSETLLSGAIENSVYFSAVCGSLSCGVEGLPVGAVYSAVGAMADGNYKFLGMNANAVSELITGGLLGLALAQKYSRDQQRTMQGLATLTPEMAHLSSLDLCVDISDLVQ